VAKTTGAAHNGAVRGRSAVAVLAVLLVSTVTACMSAAESTRPAKRAAVAPSAAPRGRQALGAPGCHPPSPVTLWNSFLPQVEGTGHGARLWGLLMFPHRLPARVGDQEKIVWRMTGTGLLTTLAAIGPEGKHHRLAWGPAAHMSGSTWDKPGDEWGAGYVFTAPGCWDLHAVRGHATADVWIRVIAQ
jgi:hypothetical protein